MDESWDFPPLEMVIQEGVFEEMEEYVMKRHNAVAQYIAK